MAFLCAYDHAQRFLDSLRLKSDTGEKEREFGSRNDLVQIKVL